MGMTLTEKILARKSRKKCVIPGDTVLADVDVLMTHDVCGPGTIGIMKKEFGDDARVWRSDGVVVIPDHYIFTADAKSNRNVDSLRSFAREQDLRYFYDVGNGNGDQWRYNTAAGPLKAQFGCSYAGVCHVVLAEKGHTRPGEILIGTDSHTCTAGAFGQFATGVGNTDAAFVMGTGKILLRVPRTLLFHLEGALPPGVMAKDLILHIIGEIGFDGATYQAMEFCGPGLSCLSMEERMTIANMGVEAGGKNAIFAVDDVTCEYVDRQMREHGVDVNYDVLESDSDAGYAHKFHISLDTIEPTVALHPNPGNRSLARECGDIAIDRAYIGSCTGGKLEDFLAFAHTLGDRQASVETFGVPATVDVVRKLKETPLGNTTVWDRLCDAGVIMTENAGCAACLGGPTDTFGRVNRELTCISTTNRNFPGRMGHADARIHLASPRTVAASAIAGHIADPRDYM